MRRTHKYCTIWVKIVALRESQKRRFCIRFSQASKDFWYVLYMHRPNVKKIDICQSSVVLLQDETPDVRVKMQIIYEYMGSHWFQIVTPDRFSVNGQPRRTTNEVESFHRWFNRRCGIYHQSFWTFIEYLQKVEAGAVKDYNLAGSGRQIRREHSRKQTEKDARMRTFC
ncbi:Uncharacterized protein APZ42_029617 [Daphnia magna]|uniref:Uncharacterized protein n=1 Tax=Daphnia magna TaxID=35525 RepID=A0A164PG93_9CRUS|nr:Uncharacterized protein APZ42_029617 [Daphnia magna]